MSQPHSLPQRVAPDDRPGSVIADRALQMDMHRYARGELERVPDTLAVEEPLIVRVSGNRTLSLTRTPGDDTALVAGHLFSLGIIRRAEDIVSLCFTQCQGGTVANVRLRDPGNVRQIGMGIADRGTVSTKTLFALRRTFEDRQALFQDTGATHAAALFSLDGRLVAFGEDVGRHNAFDKVVGQALARNTLREVSIAILSSRLALELVEKGAMAGIGILCGFSVATSTAVEFARTRGITLVGRLRGNTMNVYSNQWRILP